MPVAWYSPHARQGPHVRAWPACPASRTISLTLDMRILESHAVQHVVLAGHAHFIGAHCTLHKRMLDMRSLMESIAIREMGAGKIAHRHNSSRQNGSIHRSYDKTAHDRMAHATKYLMT